MKVMSTMSPMSKASVSPMPMSTKAREPATELLLLEKGLHDIIHSATASTPTATINVQAIVIVVLFTLIRENLVGLANLFELGLGLEALLL
jgi:hypothetical protein